MALFNKVLVVLTRSPYLQRQFISDNTTGTTLLQTWMNVSAVHAPMVGHVLINSTDTPVNVLLALMV